MKNIAIIVQKLRGGGTERTASNLSEFFDGRYNVHLIVFDGRVITYPYKGTLHDLKIYPAKKYPGKIKNVFKRVHAVRKIKKEEKIDISISLMDGANIVNVLSKKNEKVITSVRNQMSQTRFADSVKKFTTNRVMKLVERKSEYIVAVSQGVNDDLVQNFRMPEEKVVTIYNPCDGELLMEEADKHSDQVLQMEPLSVTCMGRMTEQKGQWHLIRAFSQVVEKLPMAHLYIFGEGPLKDQLLELTENLRLNDHITFMGFVEAPHAYIKKSKVFVFPSLYEGIGNVLLEAMALGTPCIATDCYSGPREIIAPGTEVREKLDEVEYAEFGLLTSVGGKQILDAAKSLTVDELQLADAILSMLTDKTLREKYSSKALERSNDFLPETIVSQWTDLF